MSYFEKHMFFIRAERFVDRQTPELSLPCDYNQSLHDSIQSINTSLGIRQKGESRNGCFKKAKHAKISEKQIFLTPSYTHARVRIRRSKMFVFRKFWRALGS